MAVKIWMIRAVKRISRTLLTTDGKRDDEMFAGSLNKAESEHSSEVKYPDFSDKPEDKGKESAFIVTSSNTLADASPLISDSDFSRTSNILPTSLNGSGSALPNSSDSYDGSDSDEQSELAMLKERKRATKIFLNFMLVILQNK